jgi:tRNA (guanine37-N1)-methyltransferase
LKFTVVTLFPALIEGFQSEGLIAQARAKGLVKIDCLNPRDFAEDVHRTVDDRAFGGGDGMVMKVEPLVRTLAEIEGPKRVVVLSPQGRHWTQAQAEDWAARSESVVLVCGRYAGIDHRFTAKYADEEISLGDFILNGGELAACTVMESVIRLLPGVLGNAASAIKDSFTAGRLLECPQFTRPREVEGLPVPAPLLSGHHQRVAEFEAAVSLVRTALLRPDLLPEAVDISEALKAVLQLSAEELLSLGLSRESVEALKGTK